MLVSERCAMSCGTPFFLAYKTTFLLAKLLFCTIKSYFYLNISLFPFFIVFLQQNAISTVGDGNRQMNNG